MHHLYAVVCFPFCRSFRLQLSLNHSESQLDEDGSGACNSLREWLILVPLPLKVNVAEEVAFEHL